MTAIDDADTTTTPEPSQIGDGGIVEFSSTTATEKAPEATGNVTVEEGEENLDSAAAGMKVGGTLAFTALVGAVVAAVL